jgi:hypothetical protein
MAAPRPAFGGLAETGFDGVGGDVADDHPQLSVGGHPPRAEAPLEDMAAQPVPPVVGGPVQAVEELHAGAEIRMGRLEQEVDVIVEEAVGQTEPPLGTHYPFENGQIPPPVPLVEKDPALVVAAREDVLDRSGNVLSRFSWHTR